MNIEPFYEAIEEWKKSHGYSDEALDGDAVDEMTETFRRIANIYQGNEA